MNVVPLRRSEPVLIGSILYGAEDVITAMVADRIGGLVAEKGFGECTALGVVRRGTLIGGWVYHGHLPYPAGGVIQFSAAFDRPDWCFPQTLRTLFAYPFVQLRCVRLQAVIGRRNKRARNCIKGLGFKEEGIARRAWDGKQDAVLYGMIEHECHWLARNKDNGNLRQA